MSTRHTIRKVDGGALDVDLTRTTAIKAFCTECLGWEGHPKDCGAVLCPLFPFRGKSLLAWGLAPPELTPAQRAALAKARSTGKTLDEMPQDRSGRTPPTSASSRSSDAGNPRIDAPCAGAPGHATKGTSR